MTAHKVLVFTLALPVLLGMTLSTGAVDDGGVHELTVFAAASLTEAFRALAVAFEAKHPGTRVRFNFGGSQQLVQQIINGARADVFASANAKQLKVAITAGIIDTGYVGVFARNRLVVVTPGDNPARLRELRDLAKPDVKVILADSSVPVGQYAIQFLDRCSNPGELGNSFKKAVLKNVVSYEENVRAILSKVELGECDAGIVYSSDISQDSLRRTRRIDIPDRLNIVAEYPAGVVRGTAVHPLAEKFIDYLRSAEAGTVLGRFGFMPGTPDPRR
jgi:molybdate transport system substrate-binding protein